MQKDKISFGPLKDNGGLEKDKQKIMSDKEIKDRLSKTFEDHSIKFNEKQKEILVEAYHTVEQKTRCRQCGDESTFKIMNIRKDDTLFFCDLHFWQFCGQMVDAYKKFGIAIKEIDKMLEEK